MSRLNRRPTKVIEEPEPVAVTRAKRFYPKQKPSPPAPQATAPAGIFYQQEVASYRLPRGLFVPSAVNKSEYQDGRGSATNIDSALHGASEIITKGLGHLRMAAFEIKKLSDRGSDNYKGYAEMIGDQKNEISYAEWTNVLLGRGGILQTLQESNFVMKEINDFMTQHAGPEWNVLVARFIEAEEDDAAGTVEKLKHLKKAQANSMILRSAAAELSLRIKEDEDEKKEAQAEQDLRMEELEDLVKKQQEVLGTLLDRHRNALHEKTKEAIAKSEEISAAAMKAHQLLKKAVREARKSVATEVTEYANNIDKEIEEADDAQE